MDLCCGGRLCSPVPGHLVRCFRWELLVVRWWRVRFPVRLCSRVRLVWSQQCDGPSHIYGDNQSVLANTTMPDSMLKKKSQSIAYHLVREGSAHGEWRMAYVNTHDNEADLLTKSLPNGEKRWKFVRNILHRISRGKVSDGMN